MKKLISAMAVAAVCFSSTTYATTSTDASTTIDITGTVNSAPFDQCQVTLTNNMINLTSTADSLVEQGKNAQDMVNFTFTVSSTKSITECDKKIYAGKIAVRFVGTYDNAAGTTFANAAVGENAATGVGIGLFNYDHTPIDATQVYHIPPEGKPSSTANAHIGVQLVKLKNQSVKTGTVAGNITFQVERL
ncbi:fimbrial protein [Cronobacter turicensis]